MSIIIRLLRYHSKGMVLFIASLMVAIAGCAGPQKVSYQAKSLDRPTPIHCFDAVGHMPGTKPYIFGGNCFCTPTPELMEQYHRDGFLLDMEYDDLVRAYSDRGIQLESPSHKDCNNLCEHGPHVLKGGKCMASPTPGTVNFEEIRFGIRYLPSKQVEAIKQNMVEAK